MHFEEPHRKGAAPFHLRELFGFSPTLEGIRFIRRDPRLTASIFIKIGTGIAASCWVVFPTFASRVFLLPGLSIPRNTMLVTSILAGARGMGALAGPLCTSWWVADIQRRMALLVLAGFLLAGAGYLALSQAPTLTLACIAIFFASAGAGTIWVNSTTLLQLNSEDRFRGRVFAADQAIAMLSIAIAGFSAGRAIDGGVPVRHVALAVGIAELSLAIAWSFALPLWRTHCLEANVLAPGYEKNRHD
jgi:hypothetical protein